MIGWRNYIHFTAPDSFKSSLFVDNLRRQQYGVKLLLALYPNPRLMYALLGTSPPPPPSKKGKAVKKSWMAKEIGFSGRSVDGRSQPTHPPGPRERGGVSEKHCNFRVHFLRAPSFRFSLSLSLSFGGGKERKRRRNKERRGRERERAVSQQGRRIGAISSHFLGLNAAKFPLPSFLSFKFPLTSSFC
jgi:hypothetical protein